MDQALKDDHQITTLPANTARFQANGTWYNVTDKIATGRMAAFQKLTATYGFALNTGGFFGFLTQLWQEIQEKNFGKAAVLVYNAMEGLTKIEEGTVQAFEICTLFINADNEDARQYDEASAKKKIDDWTLAGLDSAFFLIQASSCATGYKDVYAKLSRTISQGEPLLK